MADLPLPLSAMGIDKPSFQMVRVTNHNPFPLHDRFDGVPFEFKSGEPLSIPPDAAAHFFGWPGEPELVRAYIAKRHGWNTLDDIKRDESGRMRWEEWVDKIEITHVLFDLIQRDPDAPIPADVGPEEDNVVEGDGLPIPLAGEAGDVSTTRAGTRKRLAPYGRAPRPPRKVDL